MKKLHLENRPYFWNQINRTKSPIFLEMSFVLGIDIGLDSHIVAKMPLPVEPNTKPTYEIQNNHSNQTEFP